MAFYLSRVVSGQHLAVRKLNAARVATIALEIHYAEGFAPGRSLVVAETNVNSLGH
jgi:hypothetical protein